MTGGQAVVVGVGLALILVIALAVAAFVWRQILVRRRTPEEHYRRAVKDVRRVEADLKRHGRARRKAAMAGMNHLQLEEFLLIHGSFEERKAIKERRKALSNCRSRGGNGLVPWQA